MTAMTRKHEALLEQLIGLAGDPALVEKALRDLNEELGRAPDLREIVHRILSLKHEQILEAEPA